MTDRHVKRTKKDEKEGRESSREEKSERGKIRRIKRGRNKFFQKNGTYYLKKILEFFIFYFLNL